MLRVFDTNNIKDNGNNCHVIIHGNIIDNGEPYQNLMVDAIDKHNQNFYTPSTMMNTKILLHITIL